jgi:D-tyrosyl-tRNA(Tyr) deacylase
MRAVIQRVSRAHVEVDEKVTGAIEQGLLVLLGVHRGDSKSDADYLLRKILGLRIFDDDNGKMNRSVRDINGSLLVVSQFTLYGDCRRGMRPSFDDAARPEQARELYEYFLAEAQKTGATVAAGVFQATMRVILINDGPVTLICESAKLTRTE